MVHPAPIVDLAGALGRLYARIPLGMRLGLEPMRDACAREDHPERAFATVHVAGTNGKGSVSAMVEAIARAHGMKTGLFTSPHLCRFAERIRIDGEPIDDATLAAALDRALDGAPDLSFFETATLAAFLAFREARVDLAVIEVGIGGRLDATNVVPCPRAAAITRIAFDHMDRLGSTLEAIAREKAGIAKPGLDIVVGAVAEGPRAAIDAVARAAGATTSEPIPEYAGAIGIPGDYQRDNARVAATLGERIGASPAAISRGIADVRWPGRLERIGPVLLDAAHNPDGAEALARHVRSLGIAPARVSVVFGALADKDWRPMLDAIAPLGGTRVYLAPQGGSRAGIDPGDLVARHDGTVAGSVREAIARAARGGPSGPGDGGSAELVVVAGSLVLAGEARAELLGLPRDPPVAL
ncbi:MAG TPA: folylpolyglutamate synthase/dihydrofolate synthase family protein [Polyangiaceae bacterium]|jgi:dihydrofolate synthase/folylpolyglutamate synthase|nr:folylpolyglutamate synthase/dihydrofolate synthase family protein [Polyangiaceae bacterium]